MNYMDVKGRNQLGFRDGCECKTAGRCSESDGIKLAMAYVPMQEWEKPYEPKQALREGTLFPELRLPFSGGVRR